MSRHLAHPDRPAGAGVNRSYISFAPSVLAVDGGVFASKPARRWTSAVAIGPIHKPC